MSLICFNGKYVQADVPVLSASNKSYRYGDGFFETMKVHKQNILLQHYHVQRIEASLRLLQYELPAHVTIEKIFADVLLLCQKNNCANAARVRLSFSNGDGGLFDGDGHLHYIIETWPLEPGLYSFNNNGLVTGIFPFMKKSCDAYASLKSASALIYSVAARFAAAKKWNDSIIFNHKENICETSICNIFWIKDKRIFTPSLTEGCVNGVMRACILDTIKDVTETPGRVEDIYEADEVFVTNAIRGMRWVKEVGDRYYTCNITKQIHEQIINSLA